MCVVLDDIDHEYRVSFLIAIQQSNLKFNHVG